MSKKSVENAAQHKRIYITESDFARIDDLLSTRSLQNTKHTEYLRDLRRQLDNAIVVNAKDLPEGVVSMNTRVMLTNVDTGETTAWSLVFPGSADVDQHKISIFTPAGTAIFGRWAGDVVEVKAPSGSLQVKVGPVIARPPEAVMPAG